MQAWIKMDISLWDDPRIVRLVSAIDVDKTSVIGALFRLWSLVDKFTSDGFLKGYSQEILDREVGISGFADALVSIGWLSVRKHGLQVPDFDKHHGPGAKRRAQEAQRKNASRASAGSPDNRCETSAANADKPRTKRKSQRESQRKSKGKSPLPPLEPIPKSLETPAFRTAWSDWQRHRREIKKPLTPTATAKLLKKLADMGVDRAVAAISHSLANGWQGIFEPQQQGSKVSTNGDPRGNVAAVADYVAGVKR